MKGILLTGGQATRMGRPKHWLTLKNRPLLLHTLETMGTVCHDRIIINNDPTDRRRIEELTGLPTAPDLYPGQGPLAGLHAGLQDVASEDAVCLVGCDLPFLHSEVLRVLHDLLLQNPQCQAVVPRRGERLFPVCAVYRGSAREVAERRLRQGENAMRRFLAELQVVYADTDSWEEKYRPTPFFNMNTPEAYQEACELWEKEGFDNHD